MSLHRLAPALLASLVLAAAGCGGDDGGGGGGGGEGGGGEGGGGGGGGGPPDVPQSAKALGVASTLAMLATLLLSFFFLKYGGDYGDRSEE